MQIDIPYTYEVIAIPNRCKKERTYDFAASIPLSGYVPELTAAEAPIAFRLTGTTMNSPLELRWANERLWKPAHINQTGPKLPLDSFHLMAETQSSLRLFPSRWIRTSGYDGYWTKDHPTITPTDFRRILHNNEMNVRASIVERLDNYILIDDVFHVATSEPFYTIQTFGLGANHGGTALFATHYAQNPNPDLNFRADHLDKAIAAATSIAANRGDTKNLPITPIQHIEILISEAVRVSFELESVL